MDSVSQAVLGAAIGEVVLGKKLGNKAMFWGALGGTIPDLDVITSPILSEIQSLVFHRGLSHSIMFAIIGGIGFGWLIHQLYNSTYYRNLLWIFQSLFISCIPISVCFFLFGADDHRYHFSAVAILIAGLIYYFLDKRYGATPVEEIDNPSRLKWMWMFFLAFITHSLLDCFTMYGTQLFLPFSDYRVSFATVAVSDPFGYTLPFMICLFIAMRYQKNESPRLRWAWAGLAVSSFYLMFTIWHKQVVFKEFEKQLAQQNISYDRYALGPFIFSNLLWGITVENEDRFYNGSYSIFDKSPIQFLPIEKNHHLIENGDTDPTIQTLRWFTNDFYNVMERADGKIQINDLRFGTFQQTGDISDFIFRFRLIKEKNKKYEMIATIGGPEDKNISSVMSDLLERIRGR